MIFITVGSRSFQFNRLLRAVDDAIEAGLIIDKVFAQVGSSSYDVKNYETVDFLNHDEFNAKIKECDVVVTHGGTGIIVNSVKMGKHVVAVPRLAEYNEAVDNHQIELVKAFEELGLVTGCYDCKLIGNAINSSKGKEIIPFKSNTEVIIQSIDEIIQEGLKEEKKEKIIKVLMCGSKRSEKGGMNSVIEQLMEHEWNPKFKFSYLATHVSGSNIKKALFFMFAYIKLIWLLLSNSFDIIHIHMSYKGSFYRKYRVSKICKKFNKKVIIHLHGSEFKVFYNSGNGKLKTKIVELFEMVDKVIVLGKEWYDFVCEMAPKSNVVIINNAISIPEYKKDCVGECKNILFMGALIKRKGLIDLLMAIKNIRDLGIKNFKLLIAGTGEEEEELIKYVEQNELNENVEFLGWISNDQKKNVLKTSDLLVLPSYNEGLPVAILEAMSYGIPVISTNVGSIAEAVIDNVNGFLYNPGDINELTNKIKLLITNSELLYSQSKESRKIAEEKFSDIRFFESVEREYCDIT